MYGSTCIYQFYLFLNGKMQNSMSLFKKIDQRISPVSNIILLILVCFFIFTVPFFPLSWHTLLGRIFLSLISIASIFVLHTGRRAMFTIAIIAFTTEWISGWIDLTVLNYISLFANILLFQVVAIKLIIQVAKSNKTDASVIFESINGYLMLGLMFTTWIAIAMLYDPGAFSFATENPTAQDYTYFTFVTMTTLGYGEIVPVAPFAKSLSILISTSGQIYVAVIIAMLVGKYAGSQRAD